MSNLHEDANWPRATRWLAGEHYPDADQTLGIVGLPVNLSITPGSCHLAPAAIREALQRYSLYDVETDVDLMWLRAVDEGDLDSTDVATTGGFQQVVSRLSSLYRASTCVAILGGDNAVTRPGVHALGLPLDRCGLITLDAHFDLRNLDDGLTNGNPIRALLEDGLPGKNIHQIGIQSFANSTDYAALGREAGIAVVTAEQVLNNGLDDAVSTALGALESVCDAIYVDLDVDVLDRAFAPACPGARPGGLYPWMVRSAARICGSDPKVKAIDFVEVDPTKDINDVTVLAAASFLLAFAAGVLNRPV